MTRGFNQFRARGVQIPPLPLPQVRGVQNPAPHLRSGRGQGEGDSPSPSDHVVAGSRRFRLHATAPPITASRPAPGVGMLLTFSANFVSL